MQITLPLQVSQIIETLQQHGHEAYAVGGCVRDCILGRTPDDWDITTSATPVQVKQLFKRTIDTGILHGTVTIMIGKDGFEVTTYRIDGIYEDNRHPKEVTFTSNLIEDLKRRDFTINALAYNNQDGLIDCFDGICDMKNKIVRCVGDANYRFEEDALRMMRAIRFAAQLGYTIEEKTKEAIQKLASNLKNISPERIQIELVKLVTSNYPNTIALLYELKITNEIFPEFYEITPLCMQTMKIIRNDKILRLSVFLNGNINSDKKNINLATREKNGKQALEILRRLHFDRDTIDKVSKLVYFYHTKIELDQVSIRKSIVEIGETLFPLLLEIKAAEELVKNKKEKEIPLIQKMYEQIIQENHCVSLKNLAITGRDLTELGMKPGKEMGETLKKLLEIVVIQPELNKREILLSEVSNLFAVIKDSE